MWTAIDLLALLFSFVIYITYYLFHRGRPPLPFLELPQGGGVDFQPGNVLGLTAITLLWALAMIVFVNRDGTRALRSINLTERTSRSSIWNDVFQGIQQTKDPALGSIVQVKLADGRSVQGLVEFYSDTADECAVFLSNARWIGDENEIVPIAGPGILLAKMQPLFRSAF